MNKVFPTSNDNVKNIPKSEQTKEKYTTSDNLLLKFRKYHDSESITEAKAVLQKLYIVMGITWGEYLFCQDGYA